MPLQLDLTDNELYTLSVFLKRITWTDIKSCSQDDEQAYEIKDAIIKFEKFLNDSGYYPR